MRQCDNCKSKMQPYVPRKRVGNELLCPACVRDPRRGYVSASLKDVASSRAEKDRQTAALEELWAIMSQGRSDNRGDHWEDGLDGSGVHPLVAPLHPVIWENYRHKRALRGADPYPARVFKPQADVDMAAKLREFKARPKTARKVAHGDHAHPMDEAAIKKHVIEHHGYTPQLMDPAMPDNGGPETYAEAHAASHKYNDQGDGTPKPAAPSGWKAHQHPGHQHATPLLNTAEHPLQEWEKELLDSHYQQQPSDDYDAVVSHLQSHHGFSDQDITDSVEGLYHPPDVVEALQKDHGTHHALYGNNPHHWNGQAPGHTHVWPVPSGDAPSSDAPSDQGYSGAAYDDASTPVSAGTPVIPHQDDLDYDALNQHMQQHHGYGDNYVSDLDGLKAEHAKEHGPQGVFHQGAEPDHDHADSYMSKEKAHVHADQGVDPAAPTPPVTKVKHPEHMSPGALNQHLMDYHEFNPFEDHEENLHQHHALHAAEQVEGTPHAHKGDALYRAEDDPTVGKEGEWLGGSTLPQTTSKDDAIQHLVAHHPEVDQEDYEEFTKKTGGGLKSWHQHLHSKDGAYAGLGPEDYHDHEEPKPALTTISVGTHLKHDHGMDHDEVAAMTPAEFKAHHQRLHDEGNDEEHGHSHEYPGGPVIEPRTHYPNPEHKDNEEFGLDWYHGTPAHYDGPPVSATEKKRVTGDWGRYGDGDWNCHLGSHWTSLHQMAKGFGSGRVIRARLRMRNPKVYNSLEHVAHDAYDRLVALGEIKDTKGIVGSHGDSGGDNSERCCSNDLLAYAKGTHHDRTDGKVGLQKVRDSLRADGHDGVVVRNQVDSPMGHWNAIAFSPHDVDVQDPQCPRNHGDARDYDSDNFTAPGSYHRKQVYQHRPLDEYPKDISHIERGSHTDPDYTREQMSHPTGEPGVSTYDPDDDPDEETYCHHCDSHGHSSYDDDEHEYCSVCEEYGHEETSHPYCNFCDEHADHGSDEHEDNHGEHPDFHKPEDYCANCGHVDKEHRTADNCTSCDEPLPDWNKIVSHGKPGKGWKTGDHIGDGSTEPVHPSPYNNQSYTNAYGGKDNLLKHLEEEHGSDTDFHAFKDSDGDHIQDAVEAHHTWLHQQQEKAKQAGFPTFDHKHQHLLTFKTPDAMTPEGLKVHMQTTHPQVTATQGKSHDEIKALHDQLHENGSPEEDWEDHFHHTHEESANDLPSSVHPNTAPQGIEAVQQHLVTHHMAFMKTPPEEDKDNPAWWDALHEQAHNQNLGTNSKPTNHWHAEDKIRPLPGHGYDTMDEFEEAHRIKEHLLKSHGANPSSVQHINGLGKAVQFHQTDHEENPVAALHQHTEGSKVSPYEDIWGHLAQDHGVDDPQAAHAYAGEPNEAKAHNWHKTQHLHAATGKNDVQVGHDHHGGHDDFVPPPSMLPGPAKWSNYAIHEHMKDFHGYDAKEAHSSQALNALHEHWHAHPEYAVEHGNDIDHGHTSHGGTIDKQQGFKDGDAYSLFKHMIAQHEHLTTDEDGKKKEGWGNYPTPEGLAEMQAAHQSLHAAHPTPSEENGWHFHDPDPNAPIVDDPSINDTLAKHLVKNHGWNTIHDFPEGVTNQHLIDSHHQTHHAMEPFDGQPGHTHDSSDWENLHSHPGGTKQVEPMGHHWLTVKQHLVEHHGWLASKWNDLSDAAHASMPDELGTPGIEPWKTQVAQQAHDQEHLHDQTLSHEHPHGLLKPHEDTPEGKQYHHLSVDHGYVGSPGHLLDQDMDAIHASLHDEQGKMTHLHEAPAFLGKDAYPSNPHHHNEDGKAIYNGTASPKYVVGGPYVKMSVPEMKDHLTEHHGHTFWSWEAKDPVALANQHKNLHHSDGTAMHPELSQGKKLPGWSQHTHTDEGGTEHFEEHPALAAGWDTDELKAHLAEHHPAIEHDGTDLNWHHGVAHGHDDEKGQTQQTHFHALAPASQQHPQDMEGLLAHINAHHHDIPSSKMSKALVEEWHDQVHAAGGYGHTHTGDKPVVTPVAQHGPIDAATDPAKIKQHLVEHHDFGPSNFDGHYEKAYAGLHDIEHAFGLPDGVQHTHATMQPAPQTVDDVAEHLNTHHVMPNGAGYTSSDFMDANEANNLHKYWHEHTDQGAWATHQPHDHIEAEVGPKVVGPKVHATPYDLGAMKQHLKDDHGFAAPSAAGSVDNIETMDQAIKAHDYNHAHHGDGTDWPPHAHTQPAHMQGEPLKGHEVASASPAPVHVPSQDEIKGSQQTLSEHMKSHHPDVPYYGNFTHDQQQHDEAHAQSLDHEHAPPSIKTMHPDSAEQLHDPANESALKNHLLQHHWAPGNQMHDFISHGTLVSHHTKQHEAQPGNVAYPHVPHEHATESVAPTIPGAAPHHEHTHVDVTDHMVAMHGIDPHEDWSQHGDLHDWHTEMHTHDQELQDHHHAEGKPAQPGHPPGWAPQPKMNPPITSAAPHIQQLHMQHQHGLDVGLVESLHESGELHSAHEALHVGTGPGQVVEPYHHEHEDLPNGQPKTTASRGDYQANLAIGSSLVTDPIDFFRAAMEAAR